MKKHSLILALALGAALSSCAQQVPARTISQEDFINAAESTVNGVVSVKSFATPRGQHYGNMGGDPFDDPFFQYFFGQPQRRQQEPRQAEQRQVGLGSGVIITTDGLIVTNNHVIDGAERLEVTLNDNRNFAATVVGADPVTDLALIRIDAPADLHVIPMGNSEDLHVGEWVLAVGNPFGFTSTVTSGIVSAKARNISTTTQTPGNGGIEAYIQTDAAVNRGNSGGALVNLKGELVGINTAIYSQTGTYAGCSFAIPTTIVQKVVDDLRQFGTVQRAYLGISFVELTPELISEKQIKGATRGIYVAEVQDRTAAREAGLQPGDVVTEINGIEITGTARLQEVMARLSPGDKVTISYVRDGRPESVSVTLRNRNGNTSVTRAETATAVLGATFSPVSDETRQRLEISRGVEVSSEIAP
ncbi:MAG: trypsin-like peptidase domain-containing protein [Bacteroidales bacterium]|nr:trypsin-like peptidase domain-containing protein [Bacteroidales bacterium]